MKKSIEELERKTFEEDGPSVHPPADILAYNELRSCADLNRMFEEGILQIQPEFQRDVVWKGPAKTRFIDSLVKQLPIPSMCFGLDYQQQRWIVIDGLQRMATITQFLSAKEWKLSKLLDIDQRLSGASNVDLRDPRSPLNPLYRRVQNLTLPITVLRCDYSKEQHMEYLYMIFHRLNAEGMKLNNQEIRNCIYSGRFNNMLKELDEHPSWRKLNKMKKGEVYRFTKQELILRFFAFFEGYRQYDGMLARFLNTYMFENRAISAGAADKKKDLFRRTVDVLFQKVFGDSTPPKLSIALIEASLFGVAKNLDFFRQLTPAQAKARFKSLQESDAFEEKTLREGLAKKQRVIDRLREAKRLFGLN